MRYTKTLVSVALSSALIAGFSGCGSDSSTSKTSTGYYVDSAVEGVDYVTSTGVSGQTGSDGAFKFLTGDSVTFKIGGLQLRTQSSLVDGASIIETDDKVITLLQSVDQDGNASNGITLNATIKEQVNTWLGGATSLDAVEVNATSGTLNNMAALQTSLQNAGETSTNTVTVTEAQAHLTQTIASVTQGQGLGTQTVGADGYIHYIDYNNNARKAPASAAAAEYHTGTGYGNTLFDSADNKCQNCHNELYDTWKGSMHGKSWTDPVFQSKFQDFLRTHIAKIGQDKTGSVGVDGITGIEYSEAKFKGVAQTCIKCHAPGAYYAGDFKVTLTALRAADDINSSELSSLKSANESNLASTTTTFDATQEAAVIAVSESNNTVYKATYQIGHEANLEGINCAFCHSIETPRMMGLANDGDTYTLKDHIRVGPHGPAKAAAGTTLAYNADSTNPDMNKFFRLWGPEKYSGYVTPKDAADFDVNKSKDGRYTMTTKDINGTNGKVHFTGGPFYGPFGVSGKSSENATDETNRTALINPHFNKDTNNHFGSSGKSLCLSCHQRSAGAAVPVGEEGAGQFMELCSTQMAVTTGDDTPTDDSMSSPKCQKCHMERIEGVLLHQWARPDLRFDATTFEAAVGYALTPELDVNDTTVAAGENPARDGWYNSHAFLGASKTGHKTSAKAKIQSGFSADVDTSSDGSTLTVTTTFANKTAHMFPGAHPMRRALTRVIVTDENGTMLAPTTMVGDSNFGDITNSVQPMSGKTLHSSADTTVSVNNNGSESLTFPGKVADLNGSAVVSQRFYSDSGVGKVSISGVDGTVKSQSVTAGATSGLVFNSAIVDSNATQKFTRIYGHETGKKYDLDSNTSTPKVFVVRPGFDSNMVASDTRLSPNETETYTLTYDISGTASVSTTYKVYYMQKGANGQFKEATDGFLNQAVSDANKFLVTEVFTKTVTE